MVVLRLVCFEKPTTGLLYFETVELGGPRAICLTCFAFWLV